MGTGPSKIDREQRFRQYHGIEDDEEYELYMKRIRELHGKRLPSSGDANTPAQLRMRGDKEMVRQLRLQHINGGGDCNWGGDDGSGYTKVDIYHVSKFTKKVRKQRTVLQEVPVPPAAQRDEDGEWVFESDEETLFNVGRER